MLIDFHTHVFPDVVARKVLPDLFTNAGDKFVPASDGTVSGLIKNMDDWGVDISVIHPVITKQSQFKNVNEWTAGLRSDRIVCFGGIYPYTDDFKRDIDFVVSLGAKGLKFHPEYQGFTVDSEHMLRVYDYALSRGLILLFHAGKDEAYLPPPNSSPEQFVKIAEAVRGGVIVLAHMGGFKQWDDVEKYLAGSEFYFDTSTGFEFFTQDQFLRVLKKHGADKILFASDSPWSKAGTAIKRLRSLPVSESDVESILGGNAKTLLGL